MNEVNEVSILIWLAIAFICAYVHKNKGYSALAGFCWGLFFSVIGLIIVLLEKDKVEHDAEIANNKGLSVVQWTVIFVVGGIIGLIIHFVIMSH